MLPLVEALHCNKRYSHVPMMYIYKPKQEILHVYN